MGTVDIAEVSKLPGLRLGTAEGRWVLIATVLASGLAGIDANVGNIALPAIGRRGFAPTA